MTLQDYVVPLTWGLNWGKSKKLIMEKHNLSLNFYEPKTLQIGRLLVYNFKGDCGTLIISNANYASVQELKALEEWCSLSGFSIIFATLADYPQKVEAQKKTFISQGWRVISNKKSNRQPEKNHIALIKNINCIYKGY